jgi:16S rRNA (guanine527-N7)-methyltransferase
MEFQEALLAACSELGLALKPAQLEQALAYTEILRRWSARLSLTTVDSPGELARFHFAEAFWAAEKHLARPLRVADIGSGAGFPGLAMKMYRPESAMSLLERNLKKVVFLETLRSRLRLSVDIARTSAESWDGWDDIDLAVMRAVRPDRRLLKPLADRAIPLLYFQAKESSPLPEPWTLQQVERYPLSNQRFMGLWKTTVSRETS